MVTLCSCLTAAQSILQAAWKAVEYVKSGMVVGLGTGSTAAFAVDRIGQVGTPQCVCRSHMYQLARL